MDFSFLNTKMSLDKRWSSKYLTKWSSKYFKNRGNLIFFQLRKHSNVPCNTMYLVIQGDSIFFDILLVNSSSHFT